MKIRIVFPSAALAVVVILIIVTFGYPYKAKLFPLLVAFPVAVLLVLNIAKEVLAAPKEKTEAETRQVPTREALFRYLAVAGWMIAFALLIYFSGYFVGIAVFFFLYLKMHGEKWLASIIYVLTTSVLVYLIFELAFDIQLYKGVFFE